MTRAEWLLARREPCEDGMCPIGASEIDEILFGEPLRIWNQKLGHEEADSYLLRRGQRMEDAIAAEYAEQTVRPVVRPEPYTIDQHRSIPWLRATCDRFAKRIKRIVERQDGFFMAESESGPLELKFAVGSYAEWKDGPPRRHVIQVQAQIACTGSSWGALAGMLGPGPLSCHDLEADHELIELALPELEAFRRSVGVWDTGAQAYRGGSPPEPRGGAAIPILKRMWGIGNGETLKLTDPTALADVLKWEQSTAVETAASERKEEYLAMLLWRMGGATWAELPDGSCLALKKSGKGTKLVRLWPRRRS